MRDEGVVLRTDRLILRPHILGDFEDSFDMWSDPTTTEFIGGHPSTREECWSRFLRYVGMWPILGCGYWRSEEHTSELQSLMRISYAVLCLNKKTKGRINDKLN